MEQYKEYYGKYPKWPITDAGYGSYDNYFYCLEKGMELGMKYNYYAKKNDKQFKKKQYNVRNWQENEEGYKICPGGQIFNLLLYEKTETNQYLKINQIYGCEGCSECEKKKDCTRSKRRTITINPISEEFQKTVDRNLGSEQGKEMKKQRSIQAEGVFGIIKQDRLYTRIKRRGLENVEMEVLKVYIGYNLTKYHRYRITKKCKA